MEQKRKQKKLQINKIDHQASETNLKNRKYL